MRVARAVPRMRAHACQELFDLCTRFVLMLATCVDLCRMLEGHPHPDGCRWLPGARLNIAECALTGGGHRLRAALVCMQQPKGSLPEQPSWLMRRCSHRTGRLMLLLLPGLQGGTPTARPYCGQTRPTPPGCTA